MAATSSASFTSRQDEHLRFAYDLRGRIYEQHIARRSRARPLLQLRCVSYSYSYSYSYSSSFLSTPTPTPLAACCLLLAALAACCLLLAAVQSARSAARPEPESESADLCITADQRTWTRTWERAAGRRPLQLRSATRAPLRPPASGSVVRGLQPTAYSLQLVVLEDDALLLRLRQIPPRLRSVRNRQQSAAGTAEPDEPAPRPAL